MHHGDNQGDAKSSKEVFLVFPVVGLVNPVAQQDDEDGEPSDDDNCEIDISN